MIVKDLITNLVPPLKITDTIELGLNWMEDYKVNHLPVVDGSTYIGLVSESELLNAEDIEKNIGTLASNFIRPIIKRDQHAYDAIKLISQLELTLLPVVDDKEEFVGAVTQRSVLEKMAGITSVQEPGGIIVLSMPSMDYNLTQIASIVETNDAKVLSVNVMSTPESREIEVTVKINREDLSRILQTFNRYNYNVIAAYHQTQYEDNLKSRYNEFIKFINI
ncbi:MAG: CBS domain-containing protein [Bacteroidota bacterium]|jgi:acetoin utilization protein AcuB